jgi:hypothetical protein
MSERTREQLTSDRDWNWPWTRCWSNIPLNDKPQHVFISVAIWMVLQLCSATVAVIALVSIGIVIVLRASRGRRA